MYVHLIITAISSVDLLSPCIVSTEAYSESAIFVIILHKHTHTQDGGAEVTLLMCCMS